MSHSRGIGAEPAPGEMLAAEDFAAVIRLTPLVSMDVVARDAAGRVLLGRRRHEPARGIYFVPGGRITKNETVAMAFRRITRAELGVEKDLSQARFLGVFDHLYRENFFGREGFGTHYVVLAWELRLEAGESALPSDQHADYAWRTEAEILGSPDVHPHTRRYFERGTAAG